MKNKIYIFYHGRFPCEKAASLFTAKNAESFAKLGYEVEVIVPKRKSVTDNTFTYHNVEENFKVTYLDCIDLINFKPAMAIGFKISHLSFSLALRKYLKTRVSKKDILYSNETISYIFVPKTEIMCYELHDFPEKNFWFYRRVFNKVSHILVTNKWKEEALHKKFPITKVKTFVELNAVDVAELNISLSKEEARAELGIPVDKKIILYTGHLYAWKGVENLIRATEYLDKDFVVYIVGGTEKDIQTFKEAYSSKSSLRIVGYRPHAQMPLWQKAADVLVIPNTAKEKISKYYTSPMKLFEYLMSKRPIIASDLPSIREIAKEADIIYFEADNPKNLSEAIEKALARNLGIDYKKNEEIINVHSWSKRAERILKNIKHE